MNKIQPSERLSGLLAFLLSGILYAAVVAAVFSGIKNRPDCPSALMAAPVRLSISQIALKTAEPPPVQPLPEPSPARPEPEQEPLPTEPEKKNVPADPASIFQEPPPESTPAQVTQEASAEVPGATRDVLLAWVREQIEKEKYYPQAARNAGYEGRFRLVIKVGTAGSITDAAVLEGRGHPLLRRSLEKIMAGLKGRNSGQTPAAPVELMFDFEFKLN